MSVSCRFQLATAVLLAVLSLAMKSASPSLADEATSNTRPTPRVLLPRMTWQWQLTGPLDTTVDAQMYDVDLFGTSADVVATLHTQGRIAICYMSAGTYEDWRPDAAAFPGPVLGSPLDDWPGERWLDIRQIRALGPIVQQRLDLCQSKGFDGVEFDNVDGYANSSGFPLTAADQLAFNTWLADQAHQRGLSAGLKNDLDQVPDLARYFDWALDEQCYEYKECEQLVPFVQAGKAVFEVEYHQDPATFCTRANAMGFSAIKKNLSVDAPRTSCV